MTTDTEDRARLRVLLVDQDPVQRTAIRAHLEGCRCEVVEAGVDEGSLEAVQRVAPHVIIADVFTPQAGGLETISTLRETAPQTCVIAMVEAGSAELLPLARQVGADGVLEKPATPDEVRRAIRAALARRRSGPSAAAAPAAEPPAARKRSPGFVYRPMWDIKRSLVSTYVCAPELPEHRLPASGNGALPLTGAQAAALASLDILALRKVISDLDAQRQAGRRVLLGCTVHFNTLKDPVLRNRYLAVCRTIGPASRTDLVLEIVLSTDDTSHFRAVDTACALDSWCRAKLVRMPRHRTSLLALERQRIHGVGLDLSDTDSPERRLVDELKAFAAGASRAGFRTYVRGLATVGLASAAVCARFDYADGDAVREVTATPDGIYRYDLRDLVRRGYDASASRVGAAR